MQPTHKSSARTMNMLQEDIELLNDFKSESLEHLNETEPLFLDVEQTEGEAQKEIVNAIFRAVHSVKGAAGFFDLGIIQNLAHTTENLLMKVRDGDLRYTADMTDALLKSVDKLRTLIAALPDVIELPIEEESAALAALAAGESAAAPTEVVETQEAAVPAVEVQVKAEVQAEVQPVAPTPQTTEPLAQITGPVGEIAQSVAPPALAPTSKEIEVAAPVTAMSASQQEALQSIAQLCNPDELEETRRFGKNAVLIELPRSIFEDAEELEKLRSAAVAVGRILAEDHSAAAPKLVLATVLEPRLLATELGIPLTHFTSYDPELLSEIGEETAPLPGTVAPLPTTEPVKKAESAEPAAAEKTVTQPAAQKKSVAKPAAPAAGQKSTRIQADAADTVRVSVSLLDDLMNLAGELVLARNQLLSSLGDTEDDAIKAILQNIDLVTSELQGNIMNTRMQPVGNVFKRFHRIVRDMSRKLGKKVDLTLEGVDVELDKSIVEVLSDPLTHLVRNSLDHGIESPKDRAASGKSDTALVSLRAYHENGLVNIEIKDDGRGIDPEKMKRIAFEKGVISEEEFETISDADAISLIFAPGFSTAEKVTDVSGRGVGMDVVKSNILKLGGKVDVESEVGVGTAIRIRLPLTLAIVPSLIVSVGDERFAVPQVNLIEVVVVRPNDRENKIEEVRGAHVLRHRGTLLPLVRIADILGIPPSKKDADDDAQVGGDDDDKASYVLVLRVDEHLYGLIADHIRDMEEIVVKPLSELIKGCKAFAGATIMGDGRVAMILDVSGIAAQAGLSFDEAMDDFEKRDEESTGVVESREVLLFTSSSTEQFAVELEKIVRIERIQENQIEMVSNAEYIQYRGRGLPLLRLERHLPVGMLEPQGKELYVLIPRVSEEQLAGILVSKVVDTVEIEVELEQDASYPPAITGRAIVDGQITLFIDTTALLENAF